MLPAIGTKSNCHKKNPATAYHSGSGALGEATIRRGQLSQPTPNLARSLSSHGLAVLGYRKVQASSIYLAVYRKKADPRLVRAEGPCRSGEARHATALCIGRVNLQAGGMIHGFFTLPLRNFSYPLRPMSPSPFIEMKVTAAMRTTLASVKS